MSSEGFVAFKGQAAMLFQAQRDLLQLLGDGNAAAVSKHRIA